MKTFDAAVLRKHDAAFEVEQVTIGDLRPNEVLVRIVGVGMCHTDLLARDEDFAYDLLPLIPGHEGSGVIESIGHDVTLVKIGDHVVISFDSCTRCASCLSGAPAYCSEFRARNVTGRGAEGTGVARSAVGDDVSNRWFGQSSFAEYSIVAERNLVVVDRSLPLELMGPLGCSIQTGAGAVLNTMRLSPGRSIAIFGAGAVGLAAVMAAKASGATEIVVSDLHESRLELALELGATSVVLGTDPDVVGRIKNGGSGVDYSLDTTAVAPVMTAAISVLRVPGKAVLVGAGMADLTIAPALLAGREVTYVLEGAAVPQLFIPRLIEMWRSGSLPFDKLIRTYRLSEINLAERDSLSGATVKPVLLTDRDEFERRP
ncbi:NAD(P)-dependent alcohol dehydrogenase [Paenarthrobacter nitroguajacolicus]|uniref:NAD(P)-dependent alcohol dehydrogenase n=1 Tax=Paenarthrobacter nitroguajacolicus TaxID=211146 RepID=UPI001C4B8B34|nr:NAD(P)-dependent alcohol dehydrogenase [Paenarthrobacter nitroguajacolicus]